MAPCWGDLIYAVLCTQDILGGRERKEGEGRREEEGG